MNPAAEIYDEPQAEAQPAPLRDDSATDWERTYSMFTHLSLLLAHAFLPIIPALVMWLVKREASPFVDDHGREALNFQISVTLYVVAGVLLIPLCGLGGIVIAAAYILGIVGMVLAARAAHRGEYFRYPVCIRLVR